MKHHPLAAPLAFAALILTACATPGSSTGPGFVYTDHYEGVMITTNVPGKKRGTACTQNIAGLVTSGDATISAAMKDGAITQVSSVDHSYKGVLGLYGKMCTIVTGN
ncbi:MAG: hypothetical protein EBX52_08035, partial [Proteobacteria bacterium]|nr:hypothetical protein [Pseudomonadota bacterium]